MTDTPVDQLARALDQAGRALGTVGTVAPTTAPWLWVAAAGLGELQLPLALVLIGPGVAVLRDVSGGWDASLVLPLVGLAAIPAGITLAQRRFVGDEVRPVRPTPR